MSIRNALILPGELPGYSEQKAVNQQNALARRQQQTAEQDRLYRTQRQGVLDQRQDTEWQQGQDDRSRTMATASRDEVLAKAEQVYKLTRGVTTPEDWEAAKRNPQLLAIDPDMADDTWEQFETFKRTLGPAFEPPEEYEGVKIGEDGYGRFAKRRGAFEVLQAATPKPLAPIQVDRDKDLYIPNPPGGSPSPSMGGFDAVYDGFVAPQEGGYTSSDGNGSPANFGINQGANPDVDVKTLTPARARELYKQRYWGPSGAENLPAPLQAVHFDTAVNMGVGAAKQLLEQSGGDPQKYLQLREARYRSIAQNNPSRAPALPTWLRRNQQLGEFIGGQGQGQMAGGDGQSGAVPGYTLARRGQAEPEDTVRRLTPQEARAQGLDPTGVYQTDGKGRVSVVDKTTDGEKQTAAFAYRVLSANDRLNSLAEQGIFKPTAMEIVTDKAGQATRIVLRNDRDRQFVQAAKEWLAPILRKDTGAAVTDTEFAYYLDIYIPRPEDDVATIRQKAAARHDAMKGLVGQAGRAFETYGQRTYNVRMPAASAPGAAQAPRRGGLINQIGRPRQAAAPSAADPLGIR